MLLGYHIHYHYITTNGSTIVLTLDSGGPTISSATPTPNPANLGDTVLTR